MGRSKREKPTVEVVNPERIEWAKERVAKYLVDLYMSKCKSTVEFANEEATKKIVT